MDLKRLRIGYLGYSQDLEHPGDKRRFVYYAKSRNLKFEVADPSKKYDLVVLSQSADLSVWCNYDLGGAKIVYDSIDSYLSIPRNEIKGRLRGLAKYIAGKSKFLRLDQWKAIEGMCLRADAVICSTEEQAKDIKPFCKNVHQILDVHTMVQKRTKNDYESGEIFNIVWEGVADNVYAFESLKGVFAQLDEKYEIALHFVTDLSYLKYSGRFGKTYTSQIIKGLSKRVYLYEWNDLMCSEIICSSDLAIIPIDLKNPLVKGKPENKLLLFWRMGMPVITSATPSYERAMKKAGLDMTCHSNQEWLEMFEKYIISYESRKAAGVAGRETAEEQYSENKTLEQWDEVFQSIL
tara:strand:+ start:498 stop:1547 length:1050 start_codon:yes stop_codon:yes gene_type:complete